MPEVTLINVYQGKQPQGSFESEAEAQAYIVARKLECRKMGVDCALPEHRFSTKVHTVNVEPEVAA